MGNNEKEDLLLGAARKNFCAANQKVPSVLQLLFAVVRVISASISSD